MTLYTIEYADADCHAVIAVFARREDRDETFRRIEAIPFRLARLTQLQEREVRLDGIELSWRDHPTDRSYHGHIYTGEMATLDAPLEVTDAREDEPTP